MKNIIVFRSLRSTESILTFTFCLISAFFNTSIASTNVNSYKGLNYGSENDPYWLHIGGSLKLDQRFFLDGKKNNLYNGAHLKELGLELSAGLGENISVNFGFDVDEKESQLGLEDAYITYSGFKHFGDNFLISIGKVNPSFCLENHTSGKWIPFLEKSSVTKAFRPSQGLGLSINNWQKDYSISGSISLAPPTVDENNQDIQASDRVQYNARLTKAYFLNNNQLVQGGVFGHFKDDANSGIRFKSTPEAVTRYPLNMFLDTKTTQNKLIRSKNHYSIGTELLFQYGPLTAEAEYQYTKVNTGLSATNLKFNGYRSNINYVLTGESRIFKNSSGTFGQVIPNHNYGAWEISGRYDYLNLNDKNVIGGTAHHVGLATTFYINYNFSVTGEFISSKIRKKTTLVPTTINTFGARLQLVF